MSVNTLFSLLLMDCNYLLYNKQRQIMYNKQLYSSIKDMKIIIHQATKHFKSKSPSPPDPTLTSYIKSHPYYHSSFPISQILKQIKQKLKKTSSSSSSSSATQMQIKGKLQQLSLYLNNDKNKSMFDIYQLVLRNKNQKGLTYKDIDSKVKIGIVSVSHYCCRLRKMNFVELKHQGNQKVVYIKNSTSSVAEVEPEQAPNPSNTPTQHPFHFMQLSMIDNIWINVSGYESYKKNGITNEDIKQRLNKKSETKLIMKMVEQVKQMYDFDKEMVSEGKVFQNRFRNITKQIKQINDQSKFNQNQNDQIQTDGKIDILNPKIQFWLRNKFPQYGEYKFLQKLIDHQFKEYLTVSNIVRSAKRSCTPIKLNRYIKILNYLDLHWPQTHNSLKKFIIEEEKDIPNGIMHKRSILSILDGLVAKGILRKEEMQIEGENYGFEDDDDAENGMYQEESKQKGKRKEIFYFPVWEASGDGKMDEQFAYNKKSKNKRQLTSLAADRQIGQKISLNDYKSELKTHYLFLTLQKLMRENMKKSLKRIRYTKRSKITSKPYQPQTHILHTLEQDNYRKVNKIRARNYEDFISQIDLYVEEDGIRQQPIDVPYEVLRLFRRMGAVKQAELKARFGNAWEDKTKQLVKNHYIGLEDNGLWTLNSRQRYFI